MTTMAASNDVMIPPKLYRIGEIVRFTGLSRQTVHNYTIMGLIAESEWTPGGHRLYDESVFRRLKRIAELKSGRSMQQIRQMLEVMDD
jgi:DNA-binding transcriptional MerR regulator